MHERICLKRRFRHELSEFLVILSKYKILKMEMSIEKVKKRRILMNKRRKGSKKSFLYKKILGQSS